MGDSMYSYVTFLVSTGYFIYLEATGVVGGSSAALDVPFTTITATSGCLKFWYHIYGQHIGDLKVYERNNAGLNNLLLEINEGRVVITLQ